MRILINNKILDKFISNIGIYSIRYNFSNIVFQSGLRRNLYEMLTELSIYKEDKTYYNQSFEYSKLEINYLYKIYHTIAYDKDFYTKEIINIDLSQYIFNLMAESYLYKYEDKFKDRKR